MLTSDQEKRDTFCTSREKNMCPKKLSENHLLLLIWLLFPSAGVFLWVGLPGQLLGQRCDLTLVSVTRHTEQHGAESRRHVKRPRSQLEPPSAHPRPLQGTRIDLSDIQSRKNELMDRNGLCSRIHSGADWRIGGLTNLLHLGISAHCLSQGFFGRTHSCLWTLWAYMDLLPLYQNWP